MPAPTLLPAVLCIGAQKAGTSWLHENLARHPGVWVPPFKELHFFDFKFVDDSKKWAKWHVRSNIKKLLKAGSLPSDQSAYLNSLIEEPFLNGTWYKKVFSAMPDDKLGIDVTPEYCSLPEEGIAFVRKFLKEPSIIYIIRDPVERALSQIKMNLSRAGNSLVDLSEWEEAAKDPVVELRGDYMSYVPRWDAAGLRMLYLPFGDIEANPKGFLRQVEEFCGLGAGEYPNAASRVFASKRVEIPTTIRSTLENKLKPQRDFLLARFGADFLGRT